MIIAIWIVAVRLAANGVQEAPACCVVARTHFVKCGLPEPTRLDHEGR
jgi:hypothetical protein